jgi:hypothetical protein
VKFVRRPDLDTKTRIDIALAAYLSQGIYGTITTLAQAYRVSRLFVYQLLWVLSIALKEEFELPTAKPRVQNLPPLDKAVLLFRLEGKCSIQSISSILQHFGYPFHSTGYISQRLSFYADRLKNTLNTEDTIKFAVFLSDEIFSGSQPILITVEPKSIAILSIALASKRDASSWKEHFLSLESNGYFCLYLVSDKAKGLTSGFNEACLHREQQSDNFHEIRDITHPLFSLEKKAYAAIEQEYRREKVLDSARSDKVLNKRIEQYEMACQKTKTCSNLYDQYAHLCGCLKELFELFDRHGNLKPLSYLYEEIEVIFELMLSLNYSPIKEVVEAMRTRKDSLFVYFKMAEQILKELSPSIRDPEAVQALCLAWQYDHFSYQAKSAKQRHFLLQERNFCLSYAEALLEDNYQQSKDMLFSNLDNVIRSSSLVETINSLIRPYLNSCKGNITQEALNLIMFYHNHRRFVDGKRKGKAPIEILTGKKLNQHWIDLLVNQSG